MKVPPQKEVSTSDMVMNSDKVEMDECGIVQAKHILGN